MKDRGTRRLVEVVFNRPLWQSFTYSIPDSMDGGDMEGCRVAAPFGTDRLIGYVWRDTASSPRSGVEIKDILERLDSSPLLAPGLMELVRWSAGYYRAPPGMMMAAAHPPGMTGRAERIAVLTGDLDGSHPLAGLIPRSGGVPVSRILENTSKGYPLESELARLEAMGLLSVYWRSASGPRPVREKVVEPALRDDRMVRRAQELKARAPRQAEILVHLAAAEGPVTRAALLRATGASASSLESLIGKGLVKQSLRRKYREPLLDGPVGEEGRIPDLNGEQREALDALRNSLDRHAVHLLHGVTGSGKTEVYLRLIGEVLQSGRSALVMVPEISLTPLTVSRFSRRFPGEVAVMHSGMSAGERLDSWNLLKTGRRRIAIGPRSAVFAPLRDLGIIVVDEEHDNSYKQDELPHYNGRDLAVVRGKQEDVPVILGSASPSMETYGNAVSGKYRLLELSERVDGIPMPLTTLVRQDDRRDRMLSDELVQGVADRTSRGEQSIVLINRRGFSPTQMCRNCGHRELCPNCGVTLTYHRRGSLLRCHYCSYWKAAMDRCPECGFDEFYHMGPGIQKVQDAMARLLPDTRVIRMDADTTSGKDSHWELLGRFARGEGDVLLGTQMVAKGHDFPNVTLVGIISADMGLAFPDFRAAERTFQLILQVSGRAGRGSIPGEVIIQVSNRLDQTIIAASEHDYQAFWERESGIRKAFGYPPYGHLVRFLWTGLDRSRVEAAAMRTVRGLDPGYEILSEPAEAAFPRINRRWRWNAIARAPERGTVGKLVERLKERFDELSPRGVRLDIDIDPYNLL